MKDLNNEQYCQAVIEALMKCSKRELAEQVLNLMAEVDKLENELNHSRSVNNNRQYRSIGGVSVQY